MTHALGRVDIWDVGDEGEEGEDWESMFMGARERGEGSKANVDMVRVETKPRKERLTVDDGDNTA